MVADRTFKIEELFAVRDKNVLITGGSRGIGEMIARGFVANGANVYISSRKPETCEALAAELSQWGTCVALPADLSKLSEVGRLAGQLQARLPRLDVLINNAGATWGAPLEEFSEAAWDKVLTLNLKTPFFLTQRLLPLLRCAATPENPARVVNISSVHGITPPEFETYSYSASKAGCIMLTRHLAKRLAQEHILVNAIAPGSFATKMMAATLAEKGEEIFAATPLGRAGDPQEIAAVALFLASRASAYITGAVVPCDGGFAEL